MEEYFEANRAARFRGVFCDAPRKQAFYSDLKKYAATSNNIPIVRAGMLFTATSARGGDGEFSIIPISKSGPIDSKDPIISHNGIITDIAFNYFEHQIISSSSTDSTIKIWKVSKKGLTSDLTEASGILKGHTDGVNCIQFHPTTNNLLVSSSSDDTVKLWDVATREALYTAAHNNVHHISWGINGIDYVLSSTTEDVKLCDGRNRKDTMANLANTSNCYAMFLGSTNIILTADAEAGIIKLFDYRRNCKEIQSIELALPLSADLIPLYDSDLRLLYVTSKDNRNVSLYDVNMKEPYIKPLFVYNSKTSAKSWCMIPKRAVNIAGCEIARIFKLTGDTIEPLSFAVPRILDNFQEDLYPDSFAGVESQSKEAWYHEDSNLPIVLANLHNEYKESETMNSSMLSRTPSHVLETTEPEDEEEMDAEDLDFEINTKLIKGTPFLKFGKRGVAHEKMLKLEKKRFIVWEGAWLSLKFGRKCSIDLEKALRIQRGQMTTKFDRENKFYGSAKNTAFSIIFIEKRKEESIDFIAQNKSDFELWFNTIEKILQEIRSTREKTALTTRFLNFTFELADKNKDNNISEKELRVLIPELSIPSSVEMVNKVLESVNPDAMSLDTNQFEVFMYSLRRRFDLEKIWDIICDSDIDSLAEVESLGFSKDWSKESAFIHKNTSVPLERFVHFWMVTTQHDDSDLTLKKAFNECDCFFRTYMGDEYLVNDPQLSYLGFFRLMNNEANDAYDPYSKTLFQDMTQPLSHYYMYSSHNTYLETDQLQGKSSVNRYINDLLRGVRCVELDTWNGDEGDPIITHGGTLTSKISFIDVIKAIKTFAFVTSPFPVVLSIENHCNLQQQRRMAIIMRGIFGDMLMDAKEGYYSRSDVVLESPDELREKILVKGARPRTAQNDLDGCGVDYEEEDMDVDYEEEEEDDEYEDDASQSVAAPGSVAYLRAQDDGASFAEDESSVVEGSIDASSVDESQDTYSLTSNSTRRKRSKLKRVTSTISAFSKDSAKLGGSKDGGEGSVTSSVNSTSTLSALGLAKEKTHEFLKSVTYIGTYKIKSFAPEFSITIPADHISSFRETTMIKLAKKHTKDWIEHNKTHLSRVYPDGVRFDSSNYDPIMAWAVGAQVIALNTQTHDLPNILNDGLFRQNAGCGYVLKPDYMLLGNAEKGSPCRICVNIISGQSFPKIQGSKEIPSPRIEISLNGLYGDAIKYQTCTVDRNGYDPIWDEAFEFIVMHSDLAQLTFQVFSGSNSIASGSIPVGRLRAGFRIVRLYDENGRNDFEFAFATLFIHVSKEAFNKAIN